MESNLYLKEAGGSIVNKFEDQWVLDESSLTPMMSSAIFACPLKDVDLFSFPAIFVSLLYKLECSNELMP